MSLEQTRSEPSAKQSSKSPDRLSESQKDLVCEEALRLMAEMPPQGSKSITPNDVKLSHMA